MIKIEDEPADHIRSVDLHIRMANSVLTRSNERGAFVIAATRKVGCLQKQPVQRGIGLVIPITTFIAIRRYRC